MTIRGCCSLTETTEFEKVYTTAEKKNLNTRRQEYLKLQQNHKHVTVLTLIQSNFVEEITQSSLHKKISPKKSYST